VRRRTKDKQTEKQEWKSRLFSSSSPYHKEHRKKCSPAPCIFPRVILRQHCNAPPFPLRIRLRHPQSLLITPSIVAKSFRYLNTNVIISTRM
jgi:hypothetical protein